MVQTEVMTKTYLKFSLEVFLKSCGKNLNCLAKYRPVELQLVKKVLLFCTVLYSRLGGRKTQ